MLTGMLPKRLVFFCFLREEMDMSELVDRGGPEVILAGGSFQPVLEPKTVEGWLVIWGFGCW